MAINSYYSSGGWATTILTSLTDLRASLDAESLKLSSGRKANNFAGLGNKVVPTLDLHARLTALSSYSDIIATANSEVGLVSQSLTSMSKLIDNVVSGPLSLAGGSDKVARISANQNLGLQFSSFLSYLNSEGNSGYSFGGDVQGNPPVKNSDLLMNGQSGMAGLKQLFAERFAADSGGDGLGRLAISGAGSTVTLGETVSPMPFGLKLSSISSGLANATVVQAAGTPPIESVAFTGQPTLGDTVTFNFNLPDGSTSALTLKVSSVAGEGQFVTGATPDDTAQNMRIALRNSLSNLVQTDLNSASAVYTAKNFFASNVYSPPERVAGTPASSATSVVAGTAANTVIWYQGKADNKDPRADRKIQIGNDITVEYGVRANESGFQSALSGIAASMLVTTNFSSSDTLAAKQMEAIRAKTLQLTKDGQSGVQSVVTSIAASQGTAKLVDEQNKSVKALLQNRLSGLEDASPEEAAANITSLTTQLQASYQVAAKLLNLSLASYL